MKGVGGAQLIGAGVCSDECILHIVSNSFDFVYNIQYIVSSWRREEKDIAEKTTLCVCSTDHNKREEGEGGIGSNAVLIPRKVRIVHHTFDAMKSIKILSGVFIKKGKNISKMYLEWYIIMVHPFIGGISRETDRRITSLL